MTLKGQKQPKKNVHETITNAIIEAIELGAGDNWRMPWHQDGNMYKGSNLVPKNVKTGNHYHGINVVAMWAAATLNGWKSGTWGTFKHWKSIGQPLMLDEKCQCRIMRMAPKKLYDKNGKVRLDDEGKEMTYQVPVFAFVYAAEQCCNTVIEAEPRLPLSERSSRLDAFFAATGADIIQKGDQPCYIPNFHQIRMPRFEVFDSVEDFYSTQCHELVHWSMKLTERDTSDYAFEELVAELGAAFLCSRLNISNNPRNDHAEYVGHWIKKMKGDTKYIFKASKLAEQAVKVLMALTEEPISRAA